MGRRTWCYLRLSGRRLDEGLGTTPHVGRGRGDDHKRPVVRDFVLASHAYATGGQRQDTARVRPEEAEAALRTAGEERRALPPFSDADLTLDERWGTPCRLWTAHAALSRQGSWSARSWG